MRVTMILACLAAVAAGSAHAQARLPEAMDQRTAACTACHGEQGKATSEGYFPRIAGKPAGYLYNQLVNFRDGRRQYPMMTYMVAHLSDEYLQEMAVYFAGLHPPYPPPQAANAPPAALERGRTLVFEGDASKNVPACAACHGKSLTGVAPAIPGLLGLPRDYLRSQFGAWRSGARRAAAPDCMAQITQRLSVEDISAVSAWLAAQPVPADMVPATAAIELPMPCGGVAQQTEAR